MAAMNKSIAAVGIVVLLVGFFLLYIAYFGPASGMGNGVFFYFGVIIGIVGIMLLFWGASKKTIRINFP